MNLAFLTKIFNKNNILVIMTAAVGILIFLNLQTCKSKANLKAELEFEK